MLRTKETPPLYKKQEEALEFVKDKRIFALFMEMGTGKSKVIVERSFKLWTEGMIDGVVIISPEAVKEQWPTDQFPEHFPSDSWNGVVWNGMKSLYAKKDFEKKLYDKEKFLVFSCNVEAFQSDSIDFYISMLTKNRKMFVVIDESTKIKNGRRKPSRGKRGGAKRTNSILDQLGPCRFKAILTGTPTPKNPFDLWSQFEFLMRDFFEMDYYIFTRRYGILIKKTNMAVKKTYHSVLDQKTFNIVKSKLSKIEKLTSTHLEDLALQMGMSTGDILIIRNMKEYSGYKNLDELREKISKITFFANKKDCIDIPDKVYETLYCSMNKEQTRIYKDLKSKMFSEYKGREISVINKVAMTMRLQMVAGGIFPYHEEHLAEDVDPTEDLEEYFKKMSSEFNSVAIEGSGKLEALVEDLECVPQETSIIVWSRFRREIDTIVERLLLEGYSCEKYYGGSSYDTIEKFKAKEVQILVANPQKGGEGLNLQVSTLHYFYSNSYRADSRLQAEDRSHRSGQINKVTYKDLVCKGTVDEVILESLKKKEDLINYFRGYSSEEFERRLSHDRVESLSRDLEAIM